MSRPTNPETLAKRVIQTLSDNDNKVNSMIMLGWSAPSICSYFEYDHKCMSHVVLKYIKQTDRYEHWVEACKYIGKTRYRADGIEYPDNGRGTDQFLTLPEALTCLHKLNIPIKKLYGKIYQVGNVAVDNLGLLVAHINRIRHEHKMGVIRLV